jgi:hypothetical protein
MHITPRSTTINANYTVMVLVKFTKSFKMKKPEMVEGDMFFQWDTAPIHTAAVVKIWLAATGRFRCCNIALFT